MVLKTGTVWPGTGAKFHIPPRRTGEAFDRRHGVETAGNIPLRAFAIDPQLAAGGNAYQPANEEDLETAIELLPIDRGRFDFFDLGCGKGKALIVASRFNFRSLTGVELIENLSQAAETNLRRLGINRVSIFTMDVRSFRFSGSHVLIFMFNPFDASVLDKVVENLKNHQNSETWIIYHAAVHSQVLKRSGFLRKITEFRGLRSKLLTEIWSGIPPTTAST